MPDLDYIGLAKRSTRCALDNSTGSVVCCGGQLARVSYNSEACYRFDLVSSSWTLMPVSIMNPKKAGAIVPLPNGDFLYGGKTMTKEWF